MQEFHHRLWTFFGSHPYSQDGQDGYRFRVWAPHAVRVCIVGDFNSWDNESLPMEHIGNGIWELFVPYANQYSTYKYAVYTSDGKILEKADPYAFHAETRPGTASKCYDLSGYVWNDEGWLAQRAKRSLIHSPLNIYELHLGSWRRNREGNFLSYHETTQWLIPYMKELGFTHVKLFPITEHPLDASLGYQCTGYFAPTSRFGTPHDFKDLINELHKAGIGILLDWVPTHFSKDDFGLQEFDGSPLYECALQPSSDTCCSDFSNPNVCDFLISSALFWLEEYHVDGLHIQLPSGSEHDVFLQQLLSEICTHHSDALMLTDTPIPSAQFNNHLICQNNRVQQVLRYTATDPYFRQHNHRELTGFMPNTESSPFILPLSHETITTSLLSSIHGSIEDKFSCLKALYIYMLTLPGKKLLMMGNEFGQRAKWNFDYSLDWHLLDLQNEDGIRHRQLHTFFKAANNLYLKSPALWKQDFTAKGFRWLCCDDAEGNIVSFLRFDQKGAPLLVSINFSPVHRTQYRIGIPHGGYYEEIFNTDQADYGGTGRLNAPVKSETIPCHEMDHSLSVNLPPLGAVIFNCSQKLPSKNQN